MANMKYLSFLLMFSCLCVWLSACSGSFQPVQGTATIPAMESAPVGTTPVPVTTPLSTGANLLNSLPRCEGIQILDEPVKFDWPNIEQRLKELEGALWGYYACPGPQAEVAVFYREQMPKTPSKFYFETNWVERVEGTVGVYYDGVDWTYLWVVPQPGNPQKSYVIVAHSNDPVSGDCFIDPPWRNRDIAAYEIHWRGT
jgi:hypothetical protein